MTRSTVTTALAAALLAGGLIAPAAGMQPQARPAGQVGTEAKADLPAAETLLEKSIEALGGREAIAALPGRVTKGKAPIGPGMMGELTLVQIPGRGAKMTMVLGGEGERVEMQAGSLDGVAWAIDPMNPQTPAAILQGEAEAAILQYADILAEIDVKDEIESAQTVALEETDSGPSYKVDLVYKDGFEESRWFNAESGLLVQTSESYETPMGNFNVTTKFSDYRDIDGVLVAFTTETVSPYGTESSTFDSVEHPADITVDAIALPDEIASLLESGDSDDAGEPEPVADVPTDG